MGSSTIRPQGLCFAKPTAHSSIKNNMHFTLEESGLIYLKETVTTPLKKRTKGNRSDENKYEFSLKPRVYR